MNNNKSGLKDILEKDIYKALSEINNIMPSYTVEIKSEPVNTADNSKMKLIGEFTVFYSYDKNIKLSRTGTFKAEALEEKLSHNWFTKNPTYDLAIDYGNYKIHTEHGTLRTRFVREEKNC